MAARKIYDCAVKTRTYQDRQTGEQKAIWKNVGAVWANDQGHTWLSLARWLNPAGIPFEEGRDTISIGLFSPKEGVPE